MNNKLIELNNKSNVYTGHVKTIYKHGDKPYQIIETHNEGTTAFFRFLLKFIMGQGTATDRPGYIKLFGNSDYTGQLVSFGILYDSVSDIVIAGSTASVTFSFFIPESLVVGKTIKSMQLCSMGSSQTVFAQVNLESAETVGSNTNIEIEWTLTLSN